jgi:2'-5' RNA ligase
LQKVDSHTYSLWLTPAEDVQETLGRLIAELAEQYGGPRFPPHITLLGSVVGPENEIIRCAEQIAEQTPPLTIELAGLGAEDVYFRSLYLVAKPVPALMAANERARQVLGSQQAEPFRPHLSLLYGDYPTQTKQAIAEAIQPRLPAACRVDTLDLYQTEPPVTAWRLVRRFVLTTGD